jgi:protein-L-isoaspartate(D-aspartate) O-methyltransferase
MKWIASLALAIPLGLGSCKKQPATSSAPPRDAQQTEPASDVLDDYSAAREKLVKQHIEGRVSDPRVLRAMREVPRHEFVPAGLRDQAYEDHPLPIGNDQTISQPLIVASMSELAQLKPGDRVLEVGTGSGYQAAVLVALGAEVYSIEIVEELARQAKTTLERLGYSANLRTGDGYAGWPDKAPFAAIIVTAAPPKIPQPLKEQLAMGGRLVIPVGGEEQELIVLTRTSETEWQRRSVYPVRFVPMTGEAQER